MKRLKIGFASIIAILAISVTIAAQAGAFESKRVVIPNCFLPSSITFDSDCSLPREGVLTPSTSCEDAQFADEKYVFGGLADAGKLNSEEVIDICNGPEFVCCVLVEPDFLCNDQQNVSLNGDPVTRYKIKEVKCRPTQQIGRASCRERV